MIKVENVKKRFKLYRKPSDRLKEIILRRSYHSVHEALRGVSFAVKDGEVLGIIGPNGAGKSTLLKILTGVVLPDEGNVYIDGKITGLLELGTGFNFELPGIDNIYMNGLFLGMSREEIDRKKEQIIAFSELGDFIYEPLKTYSSGMVMRLAFSIAIHAEPDCFVVDEALSVGDAYFQQKCVKKIKEFKERGGSIIFVSHDLNAVKVLCDRALLLHKGKVITEGTPDEVVKSYNFLLAKLWHKEDELKVNKGSFYGTYEVKIEHVSLVGRESRGGVLRSGEEALVEVEIRAFKDVDDVTVGILIRDRFGLDIFGTNTYYLGNRMSLKKGDSCKVRFKFPLNVSPGKYTLTVAAHTGKDHSERCFHWIDDALSFEVAGFKEVPFAGMVYLPVELEVERR